MDEEEEVITAEQLIEWRDDLISRGFTNVVFEIRFERRGKDGYIKMTGTAPHG